MNTLTINRLHLKNFKGIKDFTFEPMGQNASILGKNGTGKSTIMDAFFYLLFGKDSHDKADFQLKPVSADGLEIHNLETEVEAQLYINQKLITLKKVFREKWTVKKGTTAKEHTGHTTKHYVDDVPKSKTEYDKFIDGIIDINAFKLVTNPLEFNNLHWTGRQQILLDVCGVVSDQDVIDSDDSLAALGDILGDCGIDDHRKKVKEQQKKINDDLKEIPARIDELKNSIKNSEKPDQKERDLLDKELAGYQEKLRDIKSNERLSQLKVELNEVNAEITKIKSEADQKQAEARKPILAVIEKLEADRIAAETSIGELESKIQKDEDRNRYANEAKKELLNEWYKEDAKRPKNNDSCPTCGQDLPEDQINKAIEKFNQHKAEALAKIEEKGTLHKVHIEQRGKDIAAAKKKVADLSAIIIGFDATLEKKKEALESVSVPVDVEGLEKKKDALESQIGALKNGSAVQEENEQRHIDEAQAKIDAWNQVEAAWRSSGAARKRIVALEKSEKDLAEEYEELAGQIHMIERFTVQKVSMLEGNINSKFKLARFKMFKEQINGGIEECCEVLHNGVPFNHGLNSAAQVNVGLDIIDTLSNHYGFRGPIFVDNAEGVNQILPIDTQVISLVVSGDEKLTVVSA